MKENTDPESFTGHFWRKLRNVLPKQRKKDLFWLQVVPGAFKGYIGVGLIWVDFCMVFQGGESRWLGGYFW